MIAKFAALLVVATMVNADGILANQGHHVPQPYKFGYSVKDKHGEQHRQESGNGAGGVVGSYGFTDDRGVNRQVNYVADHAGFRAQVKTNEPGTANEDPAAVNIISSAHPYYGAGYGLGGIELGSAGLGVVGIGIGGAGSGYGAGYGLGAGVGSGIAGGIRNVGFGAGTPVSRLGLRGYGGMGLGYGQVTRYDSRVGLENGAHALY